MTAGILLGPSLFGLLAPGAFAFVFPADSLAITCAAINDVAAWGIMAFIVGIARSANMGGAVVTLGLALAFIVVMIWLVRPLVPRWLGEDRLAREEPTSGTLATVVCVAI